MVCMWFVCGIIYVFIGLNRSSTLEAGRLMYAIHNVIRTEQVKNSNYF